MIEFKNINLNINSFTDVNWMFGRALINKISDERMEWSKKFAGVELDVDFLEMVDEKLNRDIRTLVFRVDAEDAEEFKKGYVAELSEALRAYFESRLSEVEILANFGEYKNGDRRENYEIRIQVIRY